MSVFDFKKGDVIKNVIKSHPRYSFFIYNSDVYDSNIFPSSSIPAYSILTKDGTLSSFKTISVDSFNADFTYGEEITGPPMSFFSSSLTRYHFLENSDRQRISGSLKNILESYKIYSNHYAYSSSLGDKSTQHMSLINIPSLMYGSTIRKGSVNLKYYYSGTLAAEVEDVYKNGELIQIGPEGSNGSGSVAGVCLYNEGLLILTGSWNITQTEDFGPYGVSEGKWLYFGSGIEPKSTFPDGTCMSSSFEINFEGTNKTPVVTMFCNAPKGMLNYSNNPTFIEYGTDSYSSSERFYRESSNKKIKNINNTPYNNVDDFERTTYISKIQIYDKNKNLLGVAKLAKPIKKTEGREFTFKVKVDF